MMYFKILGIDSPACPHDGVGSRPDLCRKPNMFSVASSYAHAKRKRIIASTYSKTAIARSNTQRLIRAHTAKVISFLNKQASEVSIDHAITGPIIVRNVFRALQSDIFTAFAFSEEHGTRYLENLKQGPNTLEDLEMESLDLLHDERRDEFFFWESEKPFKYFMCLVGRHGNDSHEKAQRWLSDLMSKHENMLRAAESRTYIDKQINTFGRSVYDKLLLWNNQETGLSLDKTDRASEIMDHASKCLIIVE